MDTMINFSIYTVEPKNPEYQNVLKKLISVDQNWSGNLYLMFHDNWKTGSNVLSDLLPIHENILKEMSYIKIIDNVLTISTPYEYIHNASSSHRIENYNDISLCMQKHLKERNYIH